MGRTASDDTASTKAAASFDYSSLSETVESEVRERAQDIRALLGHRFIAVCAKAVVQVGLWLRDVHKCLGPHRFQAWRAAIFGWSKPTVSKYMRSAVVFKNVECLDQFEPGALYVLARDKVPPLALAEALARARAGDLLTGQLAAAIVDAHLGLPETANDIRRACRVVKRLRLRLVALGDRPLDNLAPLLLALLRQLRKLEAIPVVSAMIDGLDDPAEPDDEGHQPEMRPCSCSNQSTVAADRGSPGTAVPGIVATPKKVSGRNFFRGVSSVSQAGGGGIR